MRKGTATIMIFMALSGCSEMPVRTLAITHRVEPCEQPAGYAFVLRDGESCAWKRNAECYLQTPRTASYDFIGRAIRACLT